MTIAAADIFPKAALYEVMESGDKMTENKNFKNKLNGEQGLRTGDVLIGTVNGCTHQGLGVVRAQGQVVFLPNALPDEVVRLEITGFRKGVFSGRVLEQIAPSPHRAEPKCQLFGRCGGCALQHAQYEEQLRLKREIVVSSLERIGGLKNSAELVRPVIGMAEPYHYRSKGVFRPAFYDGRFYFAFLEENSHRVTADRCNLLFPPQINDLLTAAEEIFNGDFWQLAGELTGALVRTAFADGQLMLILLLKNQTPPAKGRKNNKKSKNKPRLDEAVTKQTAEFFEKLKQAVPQLTVFGYSADSGEINPIYSNLTILSEHTAITETIGDVKYEISAASFFQVNPVQTAKMLEYIKKIAATCPNPWVIDAYSGIGTIGLALAKVAERVECIEIVPQAVRDAQNNCRLNNLTNVNCVCGKAEELFHQVSRGCESGQRLVIVDPPRKGCQRQLLEGILNFAPEQVVYVSCNPATLARDLAILTADYEIKSVQPFDMFPQSYHVESVVLLSKVQK